MAQLASGSQVYGVDFPPSQYDQDWTVQANIASTSYASGTPEVAVSITAPTSGKVLVCLGAGIRNNANPPTNERAVVTYRVLEDGSQGDVFTSESAYRGIISPGPVVASTYAYRGTFSLERGLTPGRQYYIQMRHRSTSGAGAVDIASRDITVIPVP